MGKHNYYRLSEHILSLSSGKTIEEAMTEWDVTGYRLDSNFEEFCPCGHHIKEMCEIRNRVTKEETYVGNVCIHRFMKNIDKNVIVGLKRLLTDPWANASESLSYWCYFNMGFISEKEYDFLMDTKNKRNFSDKQLNWKFYINQKILQCALVKTKQIEKMVPQEKIEITVRKSEVNRWKRVSIT